MEIKHINFSKYILKNHLDNFWLSSGEDFLLYYTSQQLISLAKNLKFTIEHKHISNNESWQDLNYAISNGQLFSSNRFIVVDASKCSVNSKFAGHWNDVLNKLEATIKVCLITPKITASQKQTKWFKEMVVRHSYVAIWPLGNNYLLWLKQQIEIHHLKIAPAGLSRLQQIARSDPRITINILKKLTICFDSQDKITEKDVLNNCSELCDTSIFLIINYALSGDGKNALLLLASLSKNPGDLIIIWSVLNQTILKAWQFLAQSKGFVSDAIIIMKQQVRSFNEQENYHKLYTRHNEHSLQLLLNELRCLELLIKGVESSENVWCKLATILLKIAGRKTL